MGYNIRTDLNQLLPQPRQRPALHGPRQRQPPQEVPHCFGCGGGETGGIPTRDANVVVFIVDTLRADVMSLYGGDPRTSPNLERFAAGGATFEDCRAPSPWTLPSVGSIFTDLLNN